MSSTINLFHNNHENINLKSPIPNVIQEGRLCKNYLRAMEAPGNRNGYSLSPFPWRRDEQRKEVLWSLSDKGNDKSIDSAISWAVLFPLVEVSTLHLSRPQLMTLGFLLYNCITCIAVFIIRNRPQRYEEALKSIKDISHTLILLKTIYI